MVGAYVRYSRLYCECVRWRLQLGDPRAGEWEVIGRPYTRQPAATTSAFYGGA